MICPKCNNQNQEGAKFCTKCGATLLQAVATTQKDQKILLLSSLITFFLFIVSIIILFKLWGYFYSLGLSDSAPHGENLGQGGIVFVPLLVFFFIFSKFLATKLLENPRTAVKIIIATVSILMIALGALILFTPKDVPQTLFNRGKYVRLMRDYPDFARKPEIHSVIKSYYMSQDIKTTYESWGIIYGFEQLLELDPVDSEVKNRLVQESLELGASYYNYYNKDYNKNWLDDAIDAFKIAVQYDQKQPTVYAYLGLTYEKKGDTEEAIRQYQTALQLDPNNQRAKEGLNRLQEK